MGGKDNQAVIENKSVFCEGGAGVAHNNTTGEMHQAIVQQQQQDIGPVADNVLLTEAQMFRNSIIYKDQQLENFIKGQE